MGQSIPTELYKAVAEILAYVIKTKTKKRQMRMRQMRRGAARGLINERG